MGCILGTHGPYVYPQASPPDPLSTSWRGGTQGKILSLVPPLRIAERGTGGEDGVYAQAPRLVGPRRARSPCLGQVRCREGRCRKGRYRKARCRVAGRSGGADQASRYRSLHCGGCRILCVRKACPRRRYERREGDGKSISRGQPPTPVRQPATPYLVSSSGARSEKRQEGMAI